MRFASYTLRLLTLLSLFVCGSARATETEELIRTGVLSITVSSPVSSEIKEGTLQKAPDKIFGPSLNENPITFADVTRSL